MPLYMLVKAMTFVAVVLFWTSAGTSIVTFWNEGALQEVRLSTALRNGPPMVARALAIVHTCMYDAWAAYDDIAVGTTDINGTRRRPPGERTDANKAKAISFAAYRCLRNLYPDNGSSKVPPPSTGLGPSPSARLGAVLAALIGPYDPTETSTLDPTRPAGVGNIAAQAVIDARANDRSNQYGNASCPDGNVCPTVPVTVFATVLCTQGLPTPPLNELTEVPAPVQPLPCVGPGGKATGPYADYDDANNGYLHYIPANPLMGFCTPLLAVCPAPDPFINPNPSLPWPHVVDPNHWQPLVYDTHARQTFVGAHWERVTPFALTSADQFDSRLVVPPPDFMQNSGQYQNNVNQMIQFSRDLDDTHKFIVEYWADGPDSEFPPGHWGRFAQYVSERDQHSIDQDVKMFFAMHNASFDASIVAWHIKRKYDGVRPITAIRYTKQGQTIRVWGGPGQPTENIPGEQWMPYNPGSNLTPPFPGYFSGHSVFSRSSATVLSLFTGSDDFVMPGGPPVDFFPQCNVSCYLQDFSCCFGRVEPGIPAVDTPVSFATFSDAADQAGLSRLYGGIHFPDDNTNAQAIGALIGQLAYTKAQTYFNGTAP